MSKSAVPTVRLIYASRASETFKPREISTILAASQRNNPPLGVTGLLFLGNGFFFQCLEGSRTAVNKTYNKILNDHRHADVQLLEMKEVTERYFDSWSMKFVDLSAIKHKISNQTDLESFDPYYLDSERCDALLRAFRQIGDDETDKTGAEKAAQEIALSNVKKRSVWAFWNWF